jgi:DNA modification methylase
MQIRNRIKELRQVKASELLPNPRNWRRHPAGQADALRGALAEIGYADALIAYETPDGLMLIDGHLRAETTPDMEVPVLVTDLDEDEANKLLMTLDPLAAMASADTDIFDALRQITTVESDALQEMLDAIAGGSLKSLEAIPKPKVGLTDPDEVPPEAEEPWVQVGDLFQLGEHRVMCGDSTVVTDVDALLEGVVPMLLLTDPPYGVNYETHSDNKRIANDNLGMGQESFWADAFSIWPLNGDAYVFSPPGPLISTLARAVESGNVEHHQWLIWVKDRFALGRSHYHYRHEHIFYGWKGKSSWQGSRTLDSVWEVPRPKASPEHPTMKPVALNEMAIQNSSQQGAIVADPFLGAGSTLMAAEILNRICYGMEIEPRYVQVAIERWQNYTGQKAVKL